MGGIVMDTVTNNITISNKYRLTKLTKQIRQDMLIAKLELLATTQYLTDLMHH